MPDDANGSNGPDNGSNGPDKQPGDQPPQAESGPGGSGGNGAGRRSLWAEMSADVGLGSPSAETQESEPRGRPKAGAKKAAAPPVSPVDLDELDPPVAATVVLLRPRDGVPFEVFMVKRHSKSEFFANAYVYPGGRVEPGDVDPAMVRYVRAVEPVEMAQRLGLANDGLALGVYVAAIREAYEEAGALLATEGDGKPIDFENPDELDRYETYRAVLIEDEVDFAQVVGWEDLQLRVDALVHFAHWVTPKVERKRYDTYFFLLRAPSGQRLSHDDLETTDSFWRAPARILEDYDEGELQLAPPTLLTLRDLARFHSIDEALNAYRDALVPTIEPHPTTDEQGRLLLLLPGDLDYPGEVDGIEGAPTRVLLDGGRFVVLEPDETG